MRIISGKVTISALLLTAAFLALTPDTLVSTRAISIIPTHRFSIIPTSSSSQFTFIFPSHFTFITFPTSSTLPPSQPQPPPQPQPPQYYSTITTCNAADPSCYPTTTSQTTVNNQTIVTNQTTVSNQTASITQSLPQRVVIANSTPQPQLQDRTIMLITRMSISAWDFSFDN